jgi:hypothetical protein
MGHCGGYEYALWAIAADLVTRYGPLWQIWLCAMGHSEGFASALWAAAQHLDMRYGPKHITNYHSAEPDNIFKSLPYPLKGL